MLQKLAHLRRSPKSVRDRYAFLFASSFTVVIALLWAVTLPNRFEPVPAEEARVSGVAPFSSLLKKARDQFATVKTANEANQPVPAETVVTEPQTTAPLNPNAITLTPEDIAAVEARGGGSYSGSTTPRVVQIVTTSSQASTSVDQSTSSTQR